MKEKIDLMQAEVVKFLSEWGSFPAIKEQDDRIEEIIEALEKRLKRHQIGLESELIQVLRELGYIPDSPIEQQRIIEEILEPVFEKMSQTIADNGLEGAEIGREITLNELAVQGIAVTFSGFNEIVAEELRNRVYVFSKDTFSRIKGDFAQALTDGYIKGLGIDEIAMILRDYFRDLRDNRLRTIARTEVQGAQNMGINKTMEEFNVQYKQWLTVGDSRVRGRGKYDKADHVSLHGQVVRFDEPFSNGLFHPLDRDHGRIEDWINCRCRMRPYIPRKNEVILTTPYYP